MLGLNWMILDEILRNFSFTRPNLFIIDSPGSGLVFWSCLTSSIYVSVKNVFFLRDNFFLYVPAHSHPPLSTDFWTLQYQKVFFLANGESLYPLLWCGLTRTQLYDSDSSFFQDFLSWGGCAGSRLDHGSEIIWGGCASGRLEQNSKNPRGAALAADWIKQMTKTLLLSLFIIFWRFGGSRDQVGC